MATQRFPRILCVDDEPDVLEALKRELWLAYDVTTAENGVVGMKTAKEQGPFEVVVSDMQMPQLNGVVFLECIRQIAPPAVRVLLTDQASVDTAIAAVNQGIVFRFLTKPYSQELLIKTLEAATEQYRLVVSERVLLEQTLHGCIKILTDALSMANPAAFGRGTRVKGYVTELVAQLSVSHGWMIEIAAMLSQIGFVSLPPSTVERFSRGLELNDAEQAMVDSLPDVVDRLLANIPRLESIRAILAHQNRRFDDTDDRQLGSRTETTVVGARMLKVILDFLVLESQGMSSHLALDTMRSREGVYDPRILECFAKFLGNTTRFVEVQDLPLQSLQPGMVFTKDVKNRGGVLLISKGQEVTTSMLERLRNFTTLSPESRPPAHFLVIVRTVTSVPGNEDATHSTTDRPEHNETDPS